MELKVGDILANTGVTFGYSGRKRVAEVLSIKNDTVVIFSSGDTVEKSIPHLEVLRWWEVLPKVGEEVPSWVQRGTIFRPRGDNTPLGIKALIVSAYPGWVSYFCVNILCPTTFQVIQVKNFLDQWEPDVRPSVWDHIVDDPLENLP